MPNAQMLPTPVALMKFQLHRQAECTVFLTGAQYVRIKCALVSSAFPDPQLAPERDGMRANRSAARDFAADARSLQNTPAGRRSVRKKCPLVMTLAPSGTVSGSALLRPFHPLPVAPALAISFLFACRFFPVPLPRFPP
jgi:hypothetical protein